MKTWRFISVNKEEAALQVMLSMTFIWGNQTYVSKSMTIKQQFIVIDRKKRSKNTEFESVEKRDLIKNAC